MAKGDSTGVSATSGAQPLGPSSTNPTDFKNWLWDYQSRHNQSDPNAFGALADEAKQKFGINRFNYNGTQSNNELDVPGEGKYKVIGGEGGPGQYWYKEGQNDNPVGPSGNWMQQMMGMFGGGMQGGRQYQQPMTRRTNVMGRAMGRPQTPIGPSGSAIGMQQTGRGQI